MNNLYNKIYEAVNTGIQKALIINDSQTDDVSVKFHNKNINNSIDMYPSYVSDLLDNVTEDAYPVYENILTYYKETGLRYKPTDIYRYIQLFNKIARISNAMHTKIDMSWINSSEFISVILKDGSEMPLFLYDKKSKKGEFIKITVLGHDIILHKDFNGSVLRYNWLQETIDFDYDEFNFDKSECITMESDNDSDFNGYEHTYNNINILKLNGPGNFKNYPACEYINEQPVINGYRPYIPAITEIGFILHFLTFMKYITHYIGGHCNLTTQVAYGILSSSEQSKYWIHTLQYDNNRHSMTIHQSNKTNPFYIIPLYKKI